MWWLDDSWHRDKRIDKAVRCAAPLNNSIRPYSDKISAPESSETGSADQPRPASFPPLSPQQRAANKTLLEPQCGHEAEIERLLRDIGSLETAVRQLFQTQQLHASSAATEDRAEAEGQQLRLCREQARRDALQHAEQLASVCCQAEVARVAADMQLAEQIERHRIQQAELGQQANEVMLLRQASERLRQQFESTLQQKAELEAELKRSQKEHAKELAAAKISIAVLEARIERLQTQVVANQVADRSQNKARTLDPVTVIPPVGVVG